MLYVLFITVLLRDVVQRTSVGIGHDLAASSEAF
jgi:hypothetical protein